MSQTQSVNTVIKLLDGVSDVVYNKVEICGVDTSKLTVLKEAEKMTLLKKMHAGDRTAREKLINGNLRLVLSVIQRFTNRGENLDDLFQVGCIGLMKSIDNFDISLDVRFSTYAVPMIIGEIRRYLRDNNSIRVSRSLKELSYKAYLCREKLQERFGREPSVTELAGELGVEPEELMAALDASSEVESLHKPIYQSDGQEVSLMDRLPWRAEPEEEILDHLLLKELLGGLEKEERQLIYLRYFADRTQAQAGKELGISQVQVSRLEKKILKSMREQI